MQGTKRKAQDTYKKNQTIIRFWKVGFDQNNEMEI